MRAPSLGQVWGPSRAEVGLAFGLSSVRFFSSLALSGFARSGLGVLVLVFSFFPFLFCVPLSHVPGK